MTSVRSQEKAQEALKCSLEGGGPRSHVWFSFLGHWHLTPLNTRMLAWGWAVRLAAPQQTGLARASAFSYSWRPCMDTARPGPVAQRTEASSQDLGASSSPPMLTPRQSGHPPAFPNTEHGQSGSRAWVLGCDGIKGNSPPVQCAPRFSRQAAAAQSRQYE